MNKTYEGYQALIYDIVNDCIKEAYSRRSFYKLLHWTHRNRAKRFINSVGFDYLCLAVGIDSDSIRVKLDHRRTSCFYTAKQRNKQA